MFLLQKRQEFNTNETRKEKNENEYLLLQTFKAPCRRTQNEGVFPSSWIVSSSDSLFSPLSFLLSSGMVDLFDNDGNGSTKCRDIAAGLPTCETSRNPQTSISLPIEYVWYSKSETLV